MTRKILCVDDEENILRGFERTLRTHYQLHTAVGPKRGLAALVENGPFAVVVSDLRMPEMDGIQFLSEVRKQSPDTVRMILSGNADLEAAIASVNEGAVFQFLTKPCHVERLRVALDSALRQYELVTTERELLEGTLQGSVSMLTEVLSVVSPIAFSRGLRIREYVHHMAASLKLPKIWEFDLAAMLSQIGCITVPPDVLQKVYGRVTLSPEEQNTFAGHPLVGYGLVAKIPRLGVVAEIIRHQATPARDLRDSKISDVIAIGAQMLLVSMYFDDAISRGLDPASAYDFMAKRPEIYQASLLGALKTINLTGETMEERAVQTRDLKRGMVVNEPIRAKNGLLLVTKGEVVSETLITRLQNFGLTVGVVEPIRVMVKAIKPAAGSSVHAEQVLMR